MADNRELSLDELFARLSRMPVPDGYKVEVVEGTAHVSPQRDVHREIVHRIVHVLEARYGPGVHVMSDERIDFPGEGNGFAPDVAKIADEAKMDDQGRWSYEDVEFVAEVTSESSAGNDYGPKRIAYALAGVPVYVIVDPYAGRCHAFSQPKGGEYRSEHTVLFGTPLDLTGTAVDLVLPTVGFPQD